MNQQAMPSALSLITSPVCGLKTSTPFTFTRIRPSGSFSRSISGSPQMTHRLPLPVFLRCSARCRSAFMRAVSTGMRRADDRSDLRIAFGAERLVEAFARQPGLPGDIRHAACAGNDAERLGDKGRIIRRQSLLHIGGDGLLAVQIFGRVIG